MTLDIYHPTPPPPLEQLPNKDYPTEKNKLEEDPRRPEKQITQRSDQEPENPVDPPGIPEEPIERPEEPIERTEEPIQRPEEPIERPEEPIQRPEESTQRPEEPPEISKEPVEQPEGPQETPIELPVDTPEEFTDTPEEPTERLEEPTERLEEPTERLDKFTDQLETSTEILEESKRVYMTEKPNVSKIPDYTMRYSIGYNKYDEVSSKKQKIHFPPRPVEEKTEESSYTTFTPPITNNMPRYKSHPANKTFTTYKKQEVINESKIYVDNSFQELQSKFNAK